MGKLAEALGGSYKGLGKHASALINKLLQSFMPGGFGMSKIKDYLKAERQLSDGRIEGVLLHGLTMPPASRLGSPRMCVHLP